MRRGNGQGSIYKMSGNRRKPWRAMIAQGRTSVGYYKRVSIGCFASRIEAEAAIKRYLDTPIEKPNITLRDLHSEWKNIKYASGISKQTQDSYNAAWKWFKPLENIKVKDIRTGQLQSIIDTCPNSASSLRDIKALAHMMMEYARQNDIINKNYADFITIPKENKKEKDIFSDTEIAKIAAAAAKGNIGAQYIYIMIYTGFRISEFLTLTPFSVDLDKQTITGGMKTDAGKNRVIPIHPKIVTYITQIYNEKNSRLISHDGKPYSAKYFREKVYRPTLEKLNIKYRVPHCTRHTFATLMIRASNTPDIVKYLLGHAKYSFTVDTYGHNNKLPEMRSAIARI